MISRSSWILPAVLSTGGCLFGQIAPTRSNPVLLPTTKPVTVATGSGPQMYLAGKVVVSDGSELPPNVVIEKVCGSRRTALGYTDHKGNFNVKVSGSSLASLMDVTDDSRSIGNSPSNAREQGGVNLMGCTVDAAYAGYRSDSINVGSQRVLDNPDIGTIVLRRVGAGSGTMVSATMLDAPKSALKAYEHALDAIHKGDSETARRQLQKAVSLHPTFANAWYELGHLEMSGDNAAAQTALEKAIAADAKYIPPYTDLAILAFRRKDWKESVAIAERGLRLDSSGSPLLYYYGASAEFNAGHLDQAEKMVRDAIKYDPAHTIPKAPQLLSYILGRRGDFAGAAEQMRAYLANVTDPEAFERGQKELIQMQARADARQAK